MYIGIITFALGILFRLFMTISHDVQKRDYFFITSALVVAMYAFFRALTENLNIETSFFISFLVFIAFIAFEIKDRFLPKITEGTLYLYSLVALFTLLFYIPSEMAFYGIVKIALIVYAALLLFLCLTRVRVRTTLQVVLVVCFILSNLLIVAAFVQFSNYNDIFCITCSHPVTTLVATFFSGYVFFQLAVNLLFVLYFIPIPLSKRETMKERLQNIRQHARDLEQKYIDIDTGFNRTIFITLAVSLLLVNRYFAYFDALTTVTIVLLMGGFLSMTHEEKDLGLIKETK